MPSEDLVAFGTVGAVRIRRDQSSRHHEGPAEKSQFEADCTVDDGSSSGTEFRTVRKDRGGELLDDGHWTQFRASKRGIQHLFAINFNDEALQPGITPSGW